MAKNFEPLGTTRGLDAKFISSLKVDRHGFLWIGSREGLYRYDGYDARHYSPDVSEKGNISDTDIRFVYESEQGEIWVATNTAGLNRYLPESDSFEHYRHDSSDPKTLSHDSVYEFADGAPGELWIGSQIGLNRFNYETGDFTRFLHDPDDPTSISNDYVMALHKNNLGNIWIGTYGGGLNRKDPQSNKFIHYDLAKLIGGSPQFNQVFAIAETENGKLWIGTYSGLVRSNSDGTDFKLVSLAQPSKPEPLITSMSVDQEGVIWIATFSSGLIALQPEIGKKSYFTLESSETSEPAIETILRVNTELPGQLLIGTMGQGVHKMVQSAKLFKKIVIQDVEKKKRFENITAVKATGNKGEFWVGDYNGSIAKIDSNKNADEFVSPSKLQESNNDGVLRFLPLDDDLLVATTNSLRQFDQEGLLKKSFQTGSEQPQGLGPGFITSLLKTAPQSLWIGLGGSGLYLKQEDVDTFKNFKHDPLIETSLSGDYILALLAEGQDKIWVGTRSNGLNLCQITPWSCQRFFPVPDKDKWLNHHNISMLYRDSREHVWVATNGGGLHRILQDTTGAVIEFEGFGVAEGLISNSVMGIAEDKDGSLWVSTRAGVSRLTMDSGEVLNYNELADNEFTPFNLGAVSEDDSYIYFGNLKEVIRINKGSFFENNKPARLQLTGLENSSAEFSKVSSPWLLSRLDVAWGDTISLAFALLDYSENQHLYEYRLDEDKQWLKLNRKRQVTLANLAPGTHQFQVRGKSPYGIWSETTNLKLKVVPPFWMETWFRILVLMVSLTLLFVVHRKRMAGLHARNVELNKLKNQRELALKVAQKSQQELKETYQGLRKLTSQLDSAREDERQDISRELHDEVGQTMTAAKISLQLAQLNPDPEESNSKIQQSISMLDKMIAQVRTLSFNLRPPLLDESGLLAALHAHIEQLKNQTAISIELVTPDDLPSLPPGVKITVFRVIQEAVNNCLKHAKAEHILVSVSTQDGRLKVLVEDDGNGFNVEEVKQHAYRGEHLGLLGMDERVVSVNGTLELDSRPGKGTKLFVEIKL